MGTYLDTDFSFTSYQEAENRMKEYILSSVYI
jgi:hypothetical protein